MPDVQNCHDDNLSTPRKTQKGRIERFGLSLFFRKKSTTLSSGGRALRGRSVSTIR
jgi:hypothetical protein